MTKLTSKSSTTPKNFVTQQTSAKVLVNCAQKRAVTSSGNEHGQTAALGPSGSNMPPAKKS